MFDKRLDKRDWRGWREMWMLLRQGEDGLDKKGCGWDKCVIIYKVNLDAFVSPSLQPQPSLTPQSGHKRLSTAFHKRNTKSFTTKTWQDFHKDSHKDLTRLSQRLDKTFTKYFTKSFTKSFTTRTPDFSQQGHQTFHRLSQRLDKTVCQSQNHNFFWRVTKLPLITCFRFIWKTKTFSNNLRNLFSFSKFRGKGGNTGNTGNS